MTKHATGVVELTPAEAPHVPGATQCGTCRRWWDDDVSSSWTPAPSGRCPFEYEHAEEVEPPQPGAGYVFNPKTRRLLADVLDTLERCGCQFRMCQGDAKPPRHMLTCFNCQQIRDVRAALGLRRDGKGKR